METVLNKNNKYKVFRASAIVCLIALSLSFVGCGKRAGSSNSSAAATTIVKGSEGIKRISVKSFFGNVAKNTGIYKMIHTPTPAELAEEKASKEAMELAKEEQAAQAAADLAAHPVAGWQRLIMLAIGFLIVYLAVV